MLVRMAAVWVCLLGLCAAAQGQRPLVAVVFGDRSYRESPEAEGANALRFTNTVREALGAVGVGYTVLCDMSVETGGLDPYRVAIFPYNFVMTQEAQEAIVGFVEGGGKVVMCYAIPERIAGLLGIRVGERKEGSFEVLRLDRRRLYGAPGSVSQGSWNILPVSPVSADAEVVGEWLGPGGEPLGEPGLVVSPRGAYLGHVVTEGDTVNKGQMLLAVLGRLEPEVWAQASRGALARASEVVGSAAARVEALGDEQRGRARAELARAQGRLAEAEGLAGQGRGAEAVEAAAEARRLGERAALAASPQREGEFRGAWIHTAYGVEGWGWERSIRELRDHGFNAIIPNMLWAGLAHYPSEVLPVAAEVAERGDQLAEALRWCREYGVELHVWKVNYMLLHAPEEFIAELRAQGRLQRHRDGSEIAEPYRSAWLCPSDPRNLALERDSMLEVVRKYDVHGIHFDYIRYPHREACFCDGCRARFEQAEGVTIESWPDDVVGDGPLAERYAQWRMDQVTNLVREVSREARRLRPGVMVSAAVFQWPGARDWVQQDWPRWVEEGLLDFVCPMNYTRDAEGLERVVAREADLVAGRIPLYIGIGEFLLPDSKAVVDQLERARRMGADGFVLFSYESLGRNPERMADLHTSHTASATFAPHPAPRAEFRLPEGPAGTIGPVYAAGSPIAVEALLRAEGNYHAPIEAAAGRLRVETTEGREVRELGRVAAGRGAVARSVSLPAGRYRLAIRGRAALADGQEREFVVRSRPFEVE